jgi:hypothetical protein
MNHKIIRVWNEGPNRRFTYAFKCKCGLTDRDYISETYAREAGADHVEADPWTCCSATPDEPCKDHKPDEN